MLCKLQADCQFLLLHSVQEQCTPVITSRVILCKLHGALTPPVVASNPQLALRQQRRHYGLGGVVPGEA